MRVRRSAAGYIPTLDGWRAIAIVGVIFFHASDIYLGSLHLRGLQNVGQFGVQLFFAISGLLICGRLLDDEEKHGSFSLRVFYIRRLFRIQPAAITFLLVTGILGVMKIIPMPAGAFFTSLLGVRNLYTVNLGQFPSVLYTNHFWSLGVEEQFYLFLPAILFIVRRNRIAILGLLSIVAIAWASFAHRFHNVGAENPVRTDLQLGVLLFAATLALLLKQPIYKAWLTKWTIALATAAIVALGVSLCLMHNHYSALIVDCGFPMVILATILHPRLRWSMILESAPLLYVGRISYSAYLWQQLFFVNFANFPQANGILGRLQEWPLNLLATVVLANTSYFLIEKPMIRLGHKYTSPRQSYRAPLDLDKNRFRVQSIDI
jgi:peptidoglycan/LPS O-acetylase OafA/YrhL